MLAAVLEEGGREGGIVGVIAAEEDIRRNRLRHLYKAAVVAEGQLQRKAGLRVVQLALFQKGVGERLRPEVEKDLKARARTSTAAGQSTVPTLSCADHKCFPSG